MSLSEGISKLSLGKKPQAQWLERPLSLEILSFAKGFIHEFHSSFHKVVGVPIKFIEEPAGRALADIHFSKNEYPSSWYISSINLGLQQNLYERRRVEP
jgi:hypothetical protein